MVVRPPHLQTDEIGLVTLILVFTPWIVGIVLLLIWALRRRRSPVREAKRDPIAIVGIVLQGVGFFLQWAFPRAAWWPVRDRVGVELLLAGAIVALAWLSSWLAIRSIQILGRQWTFSARVIEGHELITSGPYRFVRNPIYLGIFGLLVATGLIYSTWWGLLAAAATFLVGTWIRIRAEEHVLREQFGTQFAEYAARVPTFFPW